MMYVLSIFSLPQLLLLSSFTNVEAEFPFLGYCLHV